ncbi:uncharacterized protein LOC127257837 [Andrographis paniculata]|uniref:uncharacterized protein LOC127257837 n=1 Tax=Andrographis paniculata TaxID=175694 RepID=UPI0021E90A1B|nr:uncharacterized protein LOC127257837 [Andrographis paniculata]XP_051140283.1 uncharacterized protein LOC127257837 [Andrographis paniculata]XP_051140284.1 uncharacterized protein LOC127257837 [Andrographis paniculata]XP_051140285.1 uncharacterized protein LOC127257837 [Andrographis paniculata]XP_051140286.1 uncharacterized protein LOC127257837 [Andrographis paniculata]XP_051140287.1 uncharacterized protein LOC127257837 [Andrographis paniculata]
MVWTSQKCDEEVNVNPMSLFSLGLIQEFKNIVGHSEGSSPSKVSLWICKIQGESPITTLQAMVGSSSGGGWPEQWTGDCDAGGGKRRCRRRWLAVCRVKTGQSNGQVTAMLIAENDVVIPEQAGWSGGQATVMLVVEIRRQRWLAIFRTEAGRSGG